MYSGQVTDCPTTGFETSTQATAKPVFSVPKSKPKKPPINISNSYKCICLRNFKKPQRFAIKKLHCIIYSQLKILKLSVTVTHNILHQLCLTPKTYSPRNQGLLLGHGVTEPTTPQVQDVSVQLTPLKISKSLCCENLS